MPACLAHRLLAASGRRNPDERCREETTQHPLYLFRRSCLPGHRGLRLEAEQDAQPRPHRQRGHALRSLHRAQLHLRAEPGDGPDREILAQQRLLQQHQQQVRRLPDHLPQAAPEGRLPDRHCRQMAPGHQPDRLRLLGDPARPGTVLQSADDPRRRTGQARGLHHRHHHRQGAGLAQETRSEQALPDDVPAQGPPPRVGAEPQVPAPLRQREVSRARDAFR